MVIFAIVDWSKERRFIKPFVKSFSGNPFYPAGGIFQECRKIRKREIFGNGQRNLDFPNLESAEQKLESFAPPR